MRNFLTKKDLKKKYLSTQNITNFIFLFQKYPKIGIISSLFFCQFSFLILIIERFNLISVIWQTKWVPEIQSRCNLRVACCIYCIHVWLDNLKTYIFINLFLWLNYSALTTFFIYQDLKMGVGELYTTYSMEEMGFNPPIKAPSKKGKRVITNPSISLNLDDLHCSKKLDFFAAVAS